MVWMSDGATAAARVVRAQADPSAGNPEGLCQGDTALGAMRLSRHDFGRPEITTDKVGVDPVRFSYIAVFERIGYEGCFIDRRGVKEVGVVQDVGFTSINKPLRTPDWCHRRAR